MLNLNLLSGSIILLKIVSKLTSMILQKISMRVECSIAMNISPSNIFPIMLLPLRLLLAAVSINPYAAGG